MSLDEAALVADVRSRLFKSTTSALTIGAELELLPVMASTGVAAPIDSASGLSLSAALRRAAVRLNWEELRSDDGAPSWKLPDASRLSFEPGGQLEISSRPYRSCSALVMSLQQTIRDVSAVAGEAGIELLALGADPYNDIAAVPLQLRGDRYVRMTRYLEARGEFGIRMMRQTAALQISVEHGPRPLERWALLNALAPYIISLFANSSRYAGRDTGHASYRAHFWRKLDGSRTGVPFESSAPAERYARFALEAGAMRADNGMGEFHEFRSLLKDELLGWDDWHFHLSTLFPEIRPKEYFEIRSADTVAAEDLAAPLAFVAGLVYDECASDAVLALLEEPGDQLLVTSGHQGLRDPQIRSRAAELVRLSIEGASRLPADYLSAPHRAHAAAWLNQRVA